MITAEQRREGEREIHSQSIKANHTSDGVTQHTQLAGVGEQIHTGSSYQPSSMNPSNTSTSTFLSLSLSLSLSRSLSLSPPPPNAPLCHYTIQVEQLSRVF